MPTLRFELTVPQPIGRVWERFQDVRELLPALTPPAQQLKIEDASPLPPQVGTIVRMSFKGPIGRVHWTARYVDCRAPHPTITGLEARFVDEQVAGPFKRWRHSHEFEAADDRSTRCIDVLDYALPLGPLGALASGLAVNGMIRRMFDYRSHRMAEIFR
ncbi:MAG: SRPBCC family protein [Tepidisphaeraceae bacterium]